MSIQKACDRITKIVSGLKKFSRSEEKVEYKLTEVKSKRHDTYIIYENNSKAFINCNEVEVEQVFINLINNAIDAVKERLEKWVKVLLYD